MEIPEGLPRGAIVEPSREKEGGPKGISSKEQAPRELGGKGRLEKGNWSF